MSKKIKNTKKIENEKKDVKNVLQTIFIGISAGVAICALVVSILTAVHQERFDKAEYEYQRSPVFEIHGGMNIQLAIVDGERVTLAYPSGFTFEFRAMNNLERLYGISPDFTVEEIPTDDIETALNNYFTRAFSSQTPDIKHGDNWYFYRFVVFKALDGTTDVQVYLYKTSPADDGKLSKICSIMRLDHVMLLDFEKAHLDDENYAGERQIAAQYREIQKYLSEFE